VKLSRAPQQGTLPIPPSPLSDTAPPEEFPIFETRELTKFYGRERGVESISIRIERGEIFGLLGPNGAGKTTVIRSAMGFLRPTSGETRLFGEVVRTSSDLHHDRVGYLPADLRLWPGLSARRTSDLLLDIGGRRDRRRRDELAERLELRMDRRVKSLSLGNRQKVGLLLALQHDPELVILDEPTSGLDPLVRQTVTEILRDFAACGGSIVYSSHNLNEVEEVCSRVGILRRGRLAALRTIAEIRAERGARLEFTLESGAPPPGDLPEALAR
jgi:ABC-2 type transport system ATP-binding protein